MKIKIDTANNKAINAELEKINGKATSFTVTSTKELIDIATRAEKKIEVLPKAMRKGVKVMFRPAGPSANAYKFSAKSTRVYLEKGATGWFLTNVQPDAVQPKRGECFDITITPAQADEIKRRAVAEFSVIA